MKKTFAYAFRHSLPIMLGFFPLGIAYGILMRSIGYNALWTGACSGFVLAGSLQFLMVSFFGGGVSIITVAALALLLNSRHIFYGVSFIEKFNSFKKSSKLFLIFALTDESYSLHCSHKITDGVREEGAYVLTAALVMLYWVGFSVLGAAVGSFITFDTTGIDFSLTALFTVILLDQLRGAGSRLPARTALVSSLLSILLFGADSFILPSLILTMAALTLLKRRIEPEEKEAET